jgi:hypothetical protein
MIELADEVVIGYAGKGGMLERLLTGVKGKTIIRIQKKMGRVELVKWANKSLHWIFTPLRSVKTSELWRYKDFLSYFQICQFNVNFLINIIIFYN